MRIAEILNDKPTNVPGLVYSKTGNEVNALHSILSLN